MRLRLATVVPAITVATAALVVAPAATAAEGPTALVSAAAEVDPGIVPQLMVTSPDGRTVFVAGTTGASGSLSWIDPSGPRERRAVRIGGRPTGLAVSPDGTRVASSSASDRFVRVFDASSGRLLRKVAVGGQPDALAIGPKGRSLFASIGNGASVARIDLRSLSVTGRYQVKDRDNRCRGGGPAGLAVSADSSTLLVTCESGGLFLLRTDNGKPIGGIDQADGGTAVPGPDGTRAYWGDRVDLWGVDIPRFPRVVRWGLLVDSDGDASDVVSATRSPVGVAITPDGAKAYAAMPDLGTVSRVDAVATTNPVTRVALGGSTALGAQELAIGADGTRLFVTTSDGRLLTVDTATDTVVGVDQLPFAASGAKAATRVLEPVPLPGGRLALGWSTYDGPGGRVTGSGLTILTLR